MYGVDENGLLDPSKSTVTVNAEDGLVSFEEETLPQIGRTQAVFIRVGSWDGSVKKVKFSEFKSLVFKDSENRWVDGLDEWSFEFEIEWQGSNTAPPQGAAFALGTFNDTNDNVGNKHRLIDYFLEVEPTAGATTTVGRRVYASVTVDPAWDERP